MTKEILDLLDKSVGFIATKGTCGNPRVRPFQSPLFYEGKLYYCTSYKKNFYKHTQAHSGVELSAYDGNSWVRIRGEAVFEENLAVKKAMFEKYPSLKELYQSPENKDFAVFYFKNPSIKIQDFNGRDEIVK
ncbi:pyridoxamine 5'-phosphate oxidase [Campylobacter sp. MIT 12-8780]|uniref:pyridoxamine 5'-phosphate oxidase family protein n=1 Tax=unclassified Campylobacter TaxID=2593542 RepID=UPI00115C478B|nr:MULTISPECIES: pyridoxamine 5'-phosphate oxidase family protein [unclassified Campylobacter]NDJ27493.1 pyridoxamine 5'-phosphate oxidase [Campylobacter sp. MIT 19-121]TQR41251.1 pyridoxamine 5'-phosphate oxidase [Campylobacter sp. MIT 12-8780]